MVTMACQCAEFFGVPHDHIMQNTPGDPSADYEDVLGKHGWFKRRIVTGEVRVWIDYQRLARALCQL